MSRALVISILGILLIGGIAFINGSFDELIPVNNKTELQTVAHVNKPATQQDVLEKLEQKIEKEKEQDKRVDSNTQVTKSSIGSNLNKSAKTEKPDELTWMSINQVIASENQEGKKYLIDLYTEESVWCKLMDKNTFTDPALKAYLNENFHVVKFNAEQKEKIEFKGKEYKWKPEGRKGVNELAEEMLDGRLSYPTLVYLDKDLNKIKVSPGYKKPDQLLIELQSLN